MSAMFRSNSSSSSAVRPNPSTTAASASGAAPAKVVPPPLSWKDAVKNGVAAAAAPVKPASARTSPRTKQQQHEHSRKHNNYHHSHHHSSSHAHDQKPRQTTCPRAKLLRSRSVSRIVESPTFRKRNDSVQSHTGAPRTESKTHESAAFKKQSPKTSPSHREAKAPASSTSARTSHTSNGSVKAALAAARARDQSPPVAKTASPATVNALFASPRKARSRETDNAGAPQTRERSASADLVLLRKSELPLWLLSESRRAGATTKSAKPRANASVHFAASSADADAPSDSRALRSRAMSVPDAPPSTRSLDEATRIAHSPVRRERSSTELTSATAAAASKANSDAIACHDDDDELSELDCDDTNSESTAESSCPSPRHSPVAGFSNHALSAHAHDHDGLSDVMSLEEEQDYEAMMLLDRINDLSAEFLAHREYEEANALAWSVEHAARQCVISHEMAQNLQANIHAGALDEARDVLYHKCHLVPAVGSVVESPGQNDLHPMLAQSFLEYVDALAPTDAPPARMHKLQVLKVLSDILTQWVKAVGRARGLAEEHVAITSGSLFLAGSYRLGLNDPTSDIDAVCVVPYHVTHEDFFSSFAATLEHTDGVTHLAPVPNAYVPLISLSYLGVSMDLLFARLPMSCVESHQEIDSDHMLVGVHAASMKSLNAPRVSSMLLCLVPKRRVFRIVLRAVRTWARRRGIYSAKLGYLGGISWAILVAFVCQMYPDAEPAKVFLRFFQVMSEWQWPQPVMLNVIYDAGLGFEMWDPRQNLYDRSHIMPIITPAYPHMNSSVQVSQSTFSVIYEEFWRARYLAEAAAGVPSALAPATSDVVVDSVDPTSAFASLYGNATEASAAPLSFDVARPAACPWEKLFEASNFFIRYDTYLVVDFEAATPNLMHKWGKFVASRLRKLVDSVQHVNLVSRVHAFPSYFPHTSTGNTPGSCMFIGVEFHARRSPTAASSSSSTAPVLLPKDDPEVKSNLEQTIRFFMATDLQQFEYKHASMTAAARLVTWDDLPAFVFPSGRSVADTERMTYQVNLEAMGFAQANAPSFRPAYYSNSYARNGRWRTGGGPRKYNGGGKGKLQRFRDGPRTYAMTQAG